jgi:hypothetical protein
MGRGPSYPYVGLEDAISLTRKMYDFTKRAPAPVDSIIKDAWKYSPTSSSGQKVLAALKAFGLVEDSPGTNGKALKVTQRAIRILLDDEDSIERRDEIKKAALSPKWYEFCWKHWGKEMPSSMRSSLLVEHGFVETTVESFLRDYRKTVAFAGLLDDSIFSDNEKGKDESDTGFKVGDYVQWESRGELRMPKAMRIAAFFDDGKFATVEGSTSPVPVAELISAEAPEEESDSQKQLPKVFPVAMKNVQSGGTTMLQETFSLPDGTSVSIQWPAAFTPEAFEDFSDWLKIVQRKIGRTVKGASGAEEPTKDAATTEPGS